MTPTDHDALDRRCAVEIMGWELNLDSRYSPHGLAKINWAPTRNIVQAWECLEKFDNFQIFSCRKKYGVNIFNDKDESFFKSAITAPLAIVLAALAARSKK